MDNYKKDMLLIDFEVRRNDVLQHLQRIEEDMRYGAIITGGLWAWIIPNLDDELVSTYTIENAVMSNDGTTVVHVHVHVPPHPTPNPDITLTYNR